MDRGTELIAGLSCDESAIERPCSCQFLKNIDRCGIDAWSTHSSIVRSNIYGGTCSLARNGAIQTPSLSPGTVETLIKGRAATSPISTRSADN